VKQPTIRLQSTAPHNGRTVVEIAGLDPAALNRLAKTDWQPGQWKALFAIHVAPQGQAKASGQPAVLGTYRIEEDVLVFEPRFPLRPGLRYRAVFDPARLPDGIAGQEPVVAELSLPPPPARLPTVIQHIYPTSDRLPENQLKLYIHFSAPMSRGEAYRRIHLMDAQDKEIELPFLELDEELWDPAGKRFTLFFDPGRIKRGLKPREEVGPALEEGKAYTLLIDRAWTDAGGNPLKEAVRKSFHVGPPAEQALDPKTWKIDPPTAGTLGPLAVSFPAPLDHALLEEVLIVTDASGHKMAGKVEISDEEKRWQFTPQQKWQSGAHSLMVETRLEDLAGNSIGRPFEVNERLPLAQEARDKIVKLPFRIR
jgi:hypothetical protein